ncbi:heavy-metal-associated domain-containing protein [Candidatus Aenigmatarchaeota archaeon]
MSKRHDIDIKGMSCKNCSDKIEAKINELGGVDNIKVDLIKNNASVSYDPKKISLSKIKSEIMSLGYSCDGTSDSRNTTILQGVGYALVPHIGCIAFIVGSVLGVTVLMEFFKPILMNRYFFHALIALSLGFATLSSVIYLRKNGLLSLAGTKRKWQYLSTMYGSTIGINLVLFMLIFPLLANVSAAGITGAVVGIGDLADSSLIKLSVDIPCPGHAPLISEELKSIEGVQNIQFSFPNVFDVIYDSTETSKGEMLSLDVFDEYPATVLEEKSNEEDLLKVNEQPTTSGGSCCGGPDCSGPSGGCGCGG